MRKICKVNKIILALMLVILLNIGVSYGAWNDVLDLNGNLTTSNFAMEFGHEDHIKVDLLTIGPDNKLNLQREIKDIQISKNDNKNLNLSLSQVLMDELSIPNNVLRIKYPIKASDKSQIKAMKNENIDFQNPHETIEVVPEIIDLYIEDRILILDEEIKNNDYKLFFDIYRQVETLDKLSTAIIFIKAYDGLQVKNLGSINYDTLPRDWDYPGLSLDNPRIQVQIKAKYSLDIAIPIEQFNTGQYK